MSTREEKSQELPSFLKGFLFNFFFFKPEKRENMAASVQFPHLSYATHPNIKVRDKQTWGQLLVQLLYATAVDKFISISY